jgi:hypothetical protein
MPYIEKHNLLFIHIPKTGGTAIERALGIKSANEPKKLISKQKELIEGVKTVPQHFTPDILRERLGEDVYESSIKFAVVRNPYTRVLSEYFYRNKTGNMKRFPKWFRNYYGNVDHVHKIPQSKFVDSDNITILRQETLQEDFSRFVEESNLPIKSELGTVNKSKHNKTDLIEEIPLPIIGRINNLFEEDFIRFGYEMLEDGRNK